MVIWCDFMAGWIGGMAGIAIGHPFDTLKVRQQALQGQSLWKTATACYKYEGGLSYPLWSTGAQNSLFFGVYGVALRNLQQGKRNVEKPSTTQIYLAGCAGGFAQLLVACPVDLVKIKLQTQTGSERIHFKGPFDVLRSVYREQGVRGWYKGLVPMAWRDCPSFGLYMYLYDGALNMCGSAESSFCQFWAGGIAGVLAWISVIWLDVVKSRIQADDPRRPRYSGTLDAFKQCYREGGLPIFTRGIVAVSLRAFPLNGTTFVAYEAMLGYCRKFHLLNESDNY